MKKPKKSKKAKKTKRKQPMKTIMLKMDRGMKERLDKIASDAETNIATACQVLLATGMHMGGNAKDAALKDAIATIMDLRAKLNCCRQIMEANDPKNAYGIFGAPIPPAADEFMVEPEPAQPAAPEGPAVEPTPP